MAKTWSTLLIGVEAQLIEIETIVGSGFSGLNILGISSEVARDMRERVRSALEAIGILIPARRVIVNISPTEIIKFSRTPIQQLDFAVAASIINALMEENKESALKNSMQFFAGELTLSGEIRPLRDFLMFESIDLQLKNFNNKLYFFPKNLNTSNLDAKYYSNIRDWYNDYFQQNLSNAMNKENEILMDTNFNKFSLVEHIESYNHSDQQNRKAREQKTEEAIGELKDNLHTLFSVLLCTIGRLNYLIAGEPGVGKSYSMHKLTKFIPPLLQDESVEVRLISPETIERPFRTPHHTTSAAALVGGAQLKPGEVTYAHNGILFLDELAEFPRHALEALREPLDTGKVNLSKAGGIINYPAKFQLCAATNPCPCGFLFSHTKPCRCNPTSVRKYQQKLSGPLLDRFALQVLLENKPQSENIFTLELKKMVNDAESLKKLTQKFITLQSKFFWRSSYILPEWDGTISKDIILKYKLSRRGEVHFNVLSGLILELFPDLKRNEAFYDALIFYRSIEHQLNSKLF